MVHVRVREQNEINRRKLASIERRRDETLCANRADQRISTHPFPEDRIGQNRHAIEIQQHRRVSEPRRRNGVRIPGLGRGCEFRLKNGPAGFSNETANRPGS